jgi:prepilin-type N-terminal cleavage/methylation domain-containing protein
MKRQFLLRRRRTAFTLVEVIVSMTILTALLTGVFSISGRCSSVVKSVKEFGAANRAVRDRVEQIRRSNWTTTTSSTALRDLVVNDIPASSDAIPSGIETLTISAYPPSSPAKTPIVIERRDGAARVVSDNPLLYDEPTLLVTDRWKWNATFGNRECVREVATVVTFRNYRR